MKSLNWCHPSSLILIEIIDLQCFIQFYFLYFMIFDNISFLWETHSKIFYISAFLSRFFGYFKSKYSHFRCNNLYYCVNMNRVLSYLNWFFFIANYNFAVGFCFYNDWLLATWLIIFAHALQSSPLSNYFMLISLIFHMYLF